MNLVKMLVPIQNHVVFGDLMKLAPGVGAKKSRQVPPAMTDGNCLSLSSTFYISAIQNIQGAALAPRPVLHAIKKIGIVRL
jgi:hypothetical protein